MTVPRWRIWRPSCGMGWGAPSAAAAAGSGSRGPWPSRWGSPPRRSSGRPRSSPGICCCPSCKDTRLEQDLDPDRSGTFCKIRISKTVPNLYLYQNKLTCSACHKKWWCETVYSNLSQFCYSWIFSNYWIRIRSRKDRIRCPTLKRFICPVNLSHILWAQIQANKVKHYFESTFALEEI